MAFSIFKQSVRLIFQNWRDVVRLAGVLYVISLAVGILAITVAPTGDDPTLPPSFIPVTILSSIVQVVALLWIAVAWHRFILLDERPNTLVPPFRGRLMLKYLGLSFGATFLCGIALLIPFVLLAIVGMLANAGLLIAVLIFLLMIPGSVALIRLSLTLPASSVEKPITFGESWKASSGKSWMIFAVAVLTFVATLVVQLPGMALSAAHQPLLSLIWGSLAGLLVTLLGLSQITTLYGVIVERREVRA